MNYLKNPSLYKHKCGKYYVWIKILNSLFIFVCVCVPLSPSFPCFHSLCVCICTHLCLIYYFAIYNFNFALNSFFSQSISALSNTAFHRMKTIVLFPKDVISGRNTPQ